MTPTRGTMAHRAPFQFQSARSPINRSPLKSPVPLTGRRKAEPAKLSCSSSITAKAQRDANRRGGMAE